MDHVQMGTLHIESAAIKITNNTFYRVSRFALGTLNSPTKSNLTTSLIFSDNAINYLSPKSFTTDFSVQIVYNHFDTVKARNNSINCSCANVQWFEESAKEKSSKGAINYYNLFDSNNENKCLNIEDCNLSKVLKNYQDLCSENYDCDEKKINVFDNLKFSKFETDLIKTIQDIDDVNRKNFWCLNFLACIIFLMICYLAVIKFLNRVKIRQFSFKRKVETNEAELNSCSSVPN